jgi:hypothetical protein
MGGGAAVVKFAGQVPRLTGFPRDFLFWLEQIREGRLKDIRTKRVHLYALSVDPDDPPAGSAVLWLSDGTGSGVEGNLVVKRTDSAGTTTTEKIDTTAV